MTRLGDLVRLLVVTAAFGFSLVFLRRAVPLGFTSPWFVLVAMLCLLGFIAFARPLFLLRMPRWLRKPRLWEVQGKIYRALGVEAFGILLRRTPLRLLNSQVYLSRHADDPTMLSAQLEAAEAAHFWTAASVIPYMVYALFQTWWSVVFWFAVIQIAGNVYPICHLRWVRGRLEHVVERRVRRRA